jgi:hypothetical protein
LAIRGRSRAKVKRSGCYEGAPVSKLDRESRKKGRSARPVAFVCRLRNGIDHLADPNVVS